MRKIKIVAVFVLILSMFTFIGCDDNGGDVVGGVEEKPNICDHMWEGHESKSPTCTEEGVWIQTCNKCGETKEESTPSFGGHIEVLDSATNPTCTNTGLTEGKHCSRCNEVLVAQIEIPALGHTEVVEEGYEPTCDNSGRTDGKHCSVCNQQLVEQERIPAKGHTEVIIPEVKATCYLPGTTEGKICSECGLKIVDQEEIPALGHQFDSNNICTVCGDPKPSEGLSFVFDDKTKLASVYKIGNCSDTEIVIPRYYKGMIVNSIYGDAFEGKTQITNVIIPDTLTVIEDGAFSGCTGLTNVELPEGLLVIEDWAFKDCLNLKNISIPNSIENIGYYAFSGCSALELYESDHCSYLGNEANKELVLYEADKEYISGHFNISSKTRIIYSTAFVGYNNLTSVSIPESVIGISSGAFYNCTGLTEVVIPNSVKYLSYSESFGTFHGCENLVNIVLPGSIEYLGVGFVGSCGKLENLYYNGTMSDYINCKLINNDRRFTIYADNFYLLDENGTQEYKDKKYSPLTTLVITDDITTIGFNHFYNFRYLTSVIISSSVTHIGYGAFAECNNITSVSYCGTEEQWNSITIENFNDPITSAQITYNYVIE